MVSAGDGFSFVAALRREVLRGADPVFEMRSDPYPVPVIKIGLNPDPVRTS